MPQELTTALKTAKDIERQLVQSENRLAYIQNEVKQLTQTKETLQSDIDKKSSEYALYIAQKDADSKKLRQAILEERDQLDKDKAEFQSILQQFQKEKALFLDEKKVVDNQNAQHEKKMNHIREFIIAVQRASSLLGL